MTLEQLEEKKVAEGWKIEKVQNTMSTRWFFVKGKYRVCYASYDASRGRTSNIHDVNCSFRAIKHYEENSKLCQKVRKNMYMCNAENKVEVYLELLLAHEESGDEIFEI